MNFLKMINSNKYYDIISFFSECTKALVWLFCILSPLYIIVEIVQKLSKGKDRKKITICIFCYGQ